MLAVKNFFMPERRGSSATAPESPAPARFGRAPDALMRSLRRRSLRVKRAKSLATFATEKRKSDSFVNSQEWTLSRTVADVRVGVVGTASSGKSALVHRYLTGAYMQEESPEGGRFKKEVVVDGHSYLLLIRDEGGPPELQFTSWVDAVIFVFSLEDETSFNAVYSYYNRMSQYRNSAEIPVILVGTQDSISEGNPRVVDEAKARKLANDLKRCSYYETCATYGLNVERVFQDACQKIVQQRLSSSTSCLTPSHSRPSTPSTLQNPQFRPQPNSSSLHGTNSPSHNHNNFAYKDPLSRSNHPLSASSHHLHKSVGHADSSSISSGVSTHHVEVHNGPEHPSKWPQSLTAHGSNQALVSIATENNNIAKFTTPHCIDNLPPPKDPKDLPTPSSTPTTSRKSRRRSNLFTPSKKGEDKLKNGELGSGRAIPIKQGYLYKKSSKALNKEWKKKYVTLCDDGRLTYHPSLHDYMEDVNGKEISLQYVTVKVPGQKPRGSKSIITIVPNNCHQASNGGADLNDGINSLSLSGKSNTNTKMHRATDRALLSAFDVLKEPATSGQLNVTSSYVNSTSNSGQGCDELSSSSSAVGSLNGMEVSSSKETPNVKKRHRRMKSSGVKKDGEDEADSSYEFTIVSLDGKRWRFEVPACGPSNGSSNGISSASAERDSWVASVEQQILASLQCGRGTGASILQCSSGRTIDAPLYIRRVYGNVTCVDCDAPDPDWASLNLGVLICIECSGIHRNLGSHISRVRSLDLDEWPLGHVSVMLSLGNTIANSIWEADLRGNIKPLANSSREDKERWIRMKYERRSFLPATLAPANLSLIHTTASVGDVATLARLLAAPPSPNALTDKAIALRAACAAGHLAAAQLLIWHNVNPNIPDSENRTCLYYAKLAVAHLQSVASRPLQGIQLSCPVHRPGAELPLSTTCKATAKQECYCPIFELLTAQNTVNALVDLLVTIQNNSIINTISNTTLEQNKIVCSQNPLLLNESHLGSASSLNGSNSTLSNSYGVGSSSTLGRNSHGNNLAVNGKYMHNSLTGSMV